MNAFARIAPVGPARFVSHRPADRGDRLARALTADASRADCTIRLTVATVEPWSSATFSGSLITLTLTAPRAPALSAWLSELPERDIPLGRDIVADLSVVPQADGWRVQALLCLDAGQRRGHG